MAGTGSKSDLRRAVATRRRSRPQAEREAAARDLCTRVLTLPEVSVALTVAAYASYPSEPGTAPLREALVARGVRVLLPVLLEDRDLDWVEDTGSAGSAGPAGLAAIGRADVVICPATAVTSTGARLGRGGGSYDRALTRVAASSLVVALVYDDELVDAVPTEAHDRPVDAVVTPHRTLRSTR